MGWQGLYRRVRGSLPLSSGEPKSPRLRAGSPYLDYSTEDQLSPGVASVRCDPVESRFRLLEAGRSLFHDVSGLHSLEQAELAMTQNQMLKREPEGNWSYQYFSPIDPKSTDSSYMTITNSPYLYYVRMDN
jgi:hypothetical protein